MGAPDAEQADDAAAADVDQVLGEQVVAQVGRALLAAEERDVAGLAASRPGRRGRSGRRSGRRRRWPRAGSRPAAARRRSGPSTYSSSSGLPDSIEKPPPPKATIWRSALSIGKWSRARRRSVVVQRSEVRQAPSPACTVGLRCARSRAATSGRLTNTTYSSRYFTDEIPEHAIPPASMPARAAYQLIHDELNLDGNPALNLASFVTTWMEPEAQQLATETLNRNFVDQDEYPQTEADPPARGQHDRRALQRAPTAASPAARRRSAPRRRSCSACSPTSGAGASGAATTAPSRTSSSAPTSTPAGRSSRATSTSSSG